MTRRYIRVGGAGPFIYDDADTITDDEYGYADGEPYKACQTDGAITTTRDPVDDDDMTRLQDVGSLNVELFTATGTITHTKSIILATGTFDLFCPTVVNGTNRFYEVKNNGTGMVILKPNTSEPAITIEEETSQPIYPGDCLTIFTDGNEWWVI